MALAYNSPGVSVSETANPALAPLLAAPSLLAVVAPARGNQTATEKLVLSGTTPQTLKNTGITEASVTVKYASDGTTVNAGNYTVVEGTDPDSGTLGDEPTTIARNAQPTVSTGTATGTGTLTGTYLFAYTWVNASGETGIGASTSSPLVLTAQGASLSGVAVGPVGTTARNIYRKKTAGTSADNIWHLVATIADNVTTVLANHTVVDATAALGASPNNGLADGESVYVSYPYADNYYFEPTLLNDMDDVVDKYGPPYDAAGLVSSQLSFLARLALVNGASEVLCVAAASSAAVDYDAALAKLESEGDVRIVVVGDGGATVASSVVAHVNKMNNQGLYRQGILGRDGSATVITAATLRAAAQGYNNEAIHLVSPASFTTQNPITGRDLKLGGQYVAAAIAGMYAGRDVQVPLTRKSVAGFTNVNDKRTASEQALDSSAGLLVIEPKGDVLRVRHGLTTAVGAVNTREGSVVRAKYEMAHRIRTTLDSSVIGIVVSQEQAPLIVQQILLGVLGQLVVEGSINGYNDVKARLLAGDPTTVEVKFAYTPAYPINNIAVIFTVNTDTGDFSLAA